MDLADMTNISIRILYENKLFKKFCAWSLHLCTSRHFPCISLVRLVIFQLNMRKQQLGGRNGLTLRDLWKASSSGSLIYLGFFVSLCALVPHRHQEAAGREPGGDRGHCNAAGLPAQAHGWDQTPGGETQVQGGSCHQNLQDSHSPCQIQLRGLAGR